MRLCLKRLNRSLILKRGFDIILASFLIILFAPLLAGVSVAIFIFLGHPIFFIQERPGKEGKPFKLIKFRTMKNSVDSKGKPLEDQYRITKFGMLLRKTSLDELPELWNILKGEMSFVGPRPLLMEYLPLYSKEQFNRHDILPGITGWAQINGRNMVSWPQRFKFDVWYVENHSFTLDLKILFKTFIKVFKQEGVSQEGFVGAEKFKGNTE